MPNVHSQQEEMWLRFSPFKTCLILKSERTTAIRWKRLYSGFKRYFPPEEFRVKDCSNEWCFWIVPDLKAGCCKWFCLCESFYWEQSLIFAINADKTFLKTDTTKTVHVPYTLKDLEFNDVHTSALVNFYRRLIIDFLSELRKQWSLCGNGFKDHNVEKQWSHVQGRRIGTRYCADTEIHTGLLFF